MKAEANWQGAKLPSLTPLAGQRLDVLLMGGGQPSTIVLSNFPFFPPSGGGLDAKRRKILIFFQK
eukprot:NODE_2423_length_789_cov_15.654054_g1687_i0.p1 GENE.NODE_2423_length_789_cov_15.654054_g1687_i0~~NODE_2423_length_789_cov_15.654054_g1687_i0.p1  ORF type:complete len:65 (+),score=1.89 NODE_2423_length_789_cov_15.654054_g1687_i0:257-451(+)